MADVFNDIKEELSDVDSLDEQKANVIMHAMVAFGEKYPKLFELLAHVVADAQYYNVEKLRGHAFSLAAMLDEKGRRAGGSGGVCGGSGSGGIAHSDAAAREARCLAKVTERVN